LEAIIDLGLAEFFGFILLQELVAHIQRRHNCDALQCHQAAVNTDLTHLFIAWRSSGSQATWYSRSRIITVIGWAVVFIFQMKPR
jgi:hypothetical protein